MYTPCYLDAVCVLRAHISPQEWCRARGCGQLSFSDIGTFVFMREFFFTSYLMRLAKSKLRGFTWHFPINTGVTSMQWVCFIMHILGIFDLELHVGVAGIGWLSTSEVMNLYFCRICSAGFFLCPKIICSRPASWDHHFINRNRCLEKLQGLVAKRKDPQTRHLCKPKSLLLCLYSSVYITFCLPVCSSISFPIQLQGCSTYVSR